MNDNPIDMEEAKAIQQIAEFSTEKLADVIVMHRYLGLYPDLSIAAMTELASRRSKGNEFDYEEYIATNLDKLPKLTINVSNVPNFLKKLINLS